jgi:ribosomal-protein-alanine N-acetyltransferase
VLRQICKADAAAIYKFRSDPEVMRYIPRPIAKTIEDVYPLIEMLDDFLIKGERINWGITLKGSDEVIGMIGFVNIKHEHFRAEVGYTLVKDKHRQGIMREALKRTLQYGFEVMNAHSIEAIVDADNKASSALLLNVGFVQEAYFREDFFHGTSFRNSIHFGMLKADWLKISK